MAFSPTDADTRCATCGTDYPGASAFFGWSARRGGLRTSCLGCERSARRRSHKKHLTANKVRAKGPAARYQQIRNGARQRGLAFELSAEEVGAFQRWPCAYCQSTEAIGLDRIDNAVGYTVSNVIPCCWPCNRMKGGLSMPEWVAHLRKIAAVLL